MILTKHPGVYETNHLEESQVLRNELKEFSKEFYTKYIYSDPPASHLILQREDFA